ncbi:MAG TPA: lysine--tRNA ligase, partial [Sphingobacteriaceae bacterium]|nr:lysine--tRNA ligase [Sphingobacteriaceae bacterium]
MSIGLSEQEIFRREALQELRKLGIDPYPPEEFEINVTAKDIQDNYEGNTDSYKNISIAGRIMTRRIMGSVS